MRHSTRSLIDPFSATPPVSRRRFLRNVVGASGTALVATTNAGSPTIAAEVSGPYATEPGSRIDQAYEMREKAALYEKRMPLIPQRTNGDEGLYSNGSASYAKALPHDAVGRVDPAAYNLLVGALTSGEPGKIEAVPLGSAMRLTNPQAGLCFGLEGADSHRIAIEPPPRFESAEQAGEMAELYWQALTRDIPFSLYDADPLISSAVRDLSRLSDFHGPRAAGQIMPGTLFRGTTPGDVVGPYISQFLWHDVPYGATTIVQRIGAAMPAKDYMSGFDEWLAIQNGAAAGMPRLETTPRYIRSARDLARYVQRDFSYQAFLNACLILLGTSTPVDTGNPYKGSATQTAFSTFGAPHVLDLLVRVANCGLKAAWYQKWYMHRRLRPEEFGGAVNNLQRKASSYPIHSDILTSPALEIVFGRSGTYLLPQAYPEGCPTHPSYPAGHAVVAGACSTVLKAFFDESAVIHRPIEASSDGISLTSYKGQELTVGGELNKLATNIAFGRNAAGIHWRSDGIEGLKLGEAVAIGIMMDERGCFSENFTGFSLTKFDGTRTVV